MPWTIRINVGYRGISTSISQVDVNLDLHSYAKSHRRRNERPVKVNDDCLTVADQKLSYALRLNPNFEGNTSASSGFTNWAA